MELATIVGGLAQLAAMVVAAIALVQIWIARRAISSTNLAGITQQLVLELRQIDELPSPARSALHALWTEQLKQAAEDSTVRVAQRERLDALLKEVFKPDPALQDDVAKAAAEWIELVRRVDLLAPAEQNQARGRISAEISRARGCNRISPAQHRRLVEAQALVLPNVIADAEAQPGRNQ